MSDFCVTLCVCVVNKSSAAAQAMQIRLADESAVNAWLPTFETVLGDGFENLMAKLSGLNIHEHMVGEYFAVTFTALYNNARQICTQVFMSDRSEAMRQRAVTKLIEVIKAEVVQPDGMTPQLLDQIASRDFELAEQIGRLQRGNCLAWIDNAEREQKLAQDTR
jgi:hypothetical protein